MGWTNNKTVKQIKNRQTEHHLFAFYISMMFFIVFVNIRERRGTRALSAFDPKRQYDL